MFCSEYEITECGTNYAAMIVINNVKKDVKSKKQGAIACANQSRFHLKKGTLKHH